MKINFKNIKPESIYQVGNVIKDVTDTLFYIILSYTLFIFADKDGYKDAKDIISVVGVVIVSMTFLMLFLGK